MRLKGKKLLYLGGIPRARFVVERAQKLGIYVIVADYTDTNPAKEIADEAVSINALDVDALEKYCREEKIDGVFSGYVDIIQPCWKELCYRLNLPCYIEDSMLLASTDKNFFKQLCSKYHVPVPQTYSVDKNNIVESAKVLSYPVFIKPLDASGSRGATVCNKEEEFIEKYNFAMSFSKKGNVTVEQFLQGTEFILDYMLIDGKVFLASMADRYTIEERGSAINHPNLMVYPSKYTNQYYKEVDPIVRKMFENEGYKNGVVFLQGYAGEKITFYEMGCRLGGTWPYIDEYFHGVNPLDMLFNFSLSGRMLDNAIQANKITAAFSGKAAVIYFISEKDEGNIAKVLGVEELRKMSYVVSIMQYYFEGDHFALGTFTDVLFLAVHLVADDFEQLKQRINKVYDLVGYYDKDGNSLLAPVYEVDKLKGYE